jgi:V/A-type H+-transporting ATPase subunit C
LFRLSDIDQLLDRLRGTPYGNVLDAVAAQFLEQNSISVFERALEDYLMRKALVLSMTDALGVGVGISYLWAKRNEVTNVRIIVKGMAVGMPEERVRGALILV